MWTAPPRLASWLTQDAWVSNAHGCRRRAAGSSLDRGRVQLDRRQGQPSLENYRYDDAANIIYQFFWGSFCDWYLEIVKLRLDFPMDGQTTSQRVSKPANTIAGKRADYAGFVFEASLRLLSPFMPFLTEEIWHALYDGKPPAKSIALTSYPQYEEHDWLSQITREC